MEKWKEKLKELKREGKVAELRALACECLRLSVPLYADPAPVLELIRQADRYTATENAYLRDISAKDFEKLCQAKGYMTYRQVRQLREAGGCLVRCATDMYHSFEFAALSLFQLSAMTEAHLEEKLGNSGAVAAATEKYLRWYIRGGDLRMQFLEAYPDSAAKLTALLEGPDAAKTLDRLEVFRSFTIHKSFRQVARKQASPTGDAQDIPDHTGPAYKVRKLGEALGVQLTRLSPEKGRSRTELTEAGEALAEWVSFRPDLFI